MYCDVQFDSLSLLNSGTLARLDYFLVYEEIFDLIIKCKIEHKHKPYHSVIELYPPTCTFNGETRNLTIHFKRQYFLCYIFFYLYTLQKIEQSTK